MLTLVPAALLAALSSAAPLAEPTWSQPYCGERCLPASGTPAARWIEWRRGYPVGALLDVASSYASAAPSSRARLGDGIERLTTGPDQAGSALTLDDALAEAAHANADVVLARANADLAGIDAYASYAGVLPRLDLSATFGHDFAGASSVVTAFPTSVDPNTGLPVFQQAVVSIPPTDNEAYSLGLTLQLPLFDGGRNWNAIRRARTSARAAGRSLDETALGVAFETIRRFYEVVKAAESLRVLEATVGRSR